MINKIKSWRRALHQIPELGFQEEKTTQYLMSELRLMGYDPQPLPNLPTGCFVFIEGESDETIAFRSDIDALPIFERTNAHFRSKNIGKMHACGHDGHMTMLLGFADSLKDYHGKYNILLLFQPGEEEPGGAKYIIDSKLLDDLNVKRVYGFHLMPTLNEGVIASKRGPLMAECGEIDILITGKASHAGIPQEGIDTIVIAAELINQFQSIISRNMSPFSNNVLNIGKIKAGKARNVVAEICMIEGTLRTYNEEDFHYIVNRMKDICKGLELAYHCEIKIKCDPLYPPVINDEKLFNELSNDLVELEEPLMLAEDFSFYTKYYPSLFMFLGTKTEEYKSGLHTSTFNFNEEVLLKGIQMYQHILDIIE